MRKILLVAIFSSILSADINSELFDSFKGSDFLSKSESIQVKEVAASAMKTIAAPQDKILIFTSFTVPNSYHISMADEVGKLQESGVSIGMEQYYVGITGKDFKKDVFEMKSDIEDLSGKTRERAIRNINIRLNPIWFDDLGIKRVPVVLLASCPGAKTDLGSCVIKAKMYGDSSLTNFYSLLSEKDNDYMRIKNILTEVKK